MTPPTRSSGKPDPRNAANSTARVLPRVTSAELMRGGAELVIDHDGREYRLRITQQGKLILTA